MIKFEMLAANPGTESSFWIFSPISTPIPNPFCCISSQMPLRQNL